MHFEWQHKLCRNFVTFCRSCKNLVRRSGESRTIVSRTGSPWWSNSFKNNCECFRNSAKLRGCSTFFTTFRRPFNKLIVDSHSLKRSPDWAPLHCELSELIRISHKPRKSNGKFALKIFVNFLLTFSRLKKIDLLLYIGKRRKSIIFFIQKPALFSKST